MGNTSGAVMVMNVRTGEILAMISMPSYDSNKFIEGISSEEWEALTKDTAKPLNNRAINALYPPGSTFKLITAISALENGWDPNKIITCNGAMALNEKRTLSCWKKDGHGDLRMVTAIKHSCNIYFANVALFTGIDNIYKTAREFGFGEKYELGLSEQRYGIIPNRDWKKKIFHDIWVKGDTVNVAIGQGFLSVTPLELLVMTARIANGGYKIKPFLVKNDVNFEYNKQIFSEEPMVAKDTLHVVKDGMYKVVNESGGTAFMARIAKHGYEMSGKTGTAQVVAKENKELSNKKYTKISFENHSIFVGFAPSNNPVYAIIVIAEHSGGGSIVAAPIARDVLYFAQQHNVGF